MNKRHRLHQINDDSPIRRKTKQRVKQMSSNVHKCVVCNKKATSKCTKCKSAYYCGKECQTKDWIQNDHKNKCNTPNVTLASISGRDGEGDIKKAKIGEEEEAFQFMELPEDLRRNVMSFLPFLTIIRLCSLNKALKAWCDGDASLWTMLLQRNMPTPAGESVSWNQPLEELTTGAIYSMIEPIVRSIPTIEGFILPGWGLLRRASARNLALAWFFVRSCEQAGDGDWRSPVTIVGPAGDPWVELKSLWSMEDIQSEYFHMGDDDEGGTEINIFNYRTLGRQFMERFSRFVKSVLTDEEGEYAQTEEKHGRDSNIIISLGSQDRKNLAAFFFALLTMGWGPNPKEDDRMYRLRIEGRI